jgi:hypothetical protein
VPTPRPVYLYRFLPLPSLRLCQALAAALLLLKDELQRALQAKHWEQVRHIQRNAILYNANS